MIGDINFLMMLVLFVSTFILDSLEATYVMSVTNLKPIQAGICRASILLIMAFGVVNYVNHLIYLLPICLGSFCGMSYSVWCHKKKSDDAS